MAEKEFKHLVRIASTDLDGNKPIGFALTNIKGVSFSFANMICNLLKLDRQQKTGELEDTTIQSIDSFLKDPQKYQAPWWMLNRKKDPELGTNLHFVGAEIDYNKDNDIKRLKMIKTYRGIRHIQGLPVRGQRTKSNFRKNKGKVLGVKRRAGAKPGK